MSTVLLFVLLMCSIAVNADQCDVTHKIRCEYYIPPGQPCSTPPPGHPASTCPTIEQRRRACLARHCCFKVVGPDGATMCFKPKPEDVCDVTRPVRCLPPDPPGLTLPIELQRKRCLEKRCCFREVSLHAPPMCYKPKQLTQPVKSSSNTSCKHDQLNTKQSYGDNENAKLCPLVESRVKCGYDDIESDHCQEMNCCFNDSNKVCYKKSYDDEYCRSVDVQERVQCVSDDSLSPAECFAAGCCYDNRVNSCFRKPQIDKRCSVAVTQRQPCNNNNNNNNKLIFISPEDCIRRDCCYDDSQLDWRLWCYTKPPVMTETRYRCQ